MVPGMEGLAAMALDVLIVSPMTAEPERVFSSSGSLLTDARAKMEDDMVEAVESSSHMRETGLQLKSMVLLSIWINLMHWWRN